jgi:hypothetical protein
MSLRTLVKSLELPEFAGQVKRLRAALSLPGSRLAANLLSKEGIRYQSVFVNSGQWLEGHRRWRDY